MSHFSRTQIRVTQLAYVGVAVRGKVASALQQRWVLGIIGIGLGLTVWQVAGLAEPVLLSTPFQSWEAFISLVMSGQLLSALADSAIIFLLGLGFAIFFGVGYGILVTRIGILRDGTQWLVYALQAVPIVAVAPIILIVIGFGVGAKSFIVFAAAVFPILINTIEGAKSVPPALLDVAHIFRSSESALWTHLLFPHTVPYAMTGIRQGIANAFVGTLVAEFFLNASGIGGLMLSASSRFDTSTVLALTVFTASVAVALMGLGRFVEDFFSSWRHRVAT